MVLVQTFWILFYYFSDVDGSNEKKKKDRDDFLPSLASNYRTIIKSLGEDPNREGLLDTPMRAAKAMTFFTKGYQETVQDVVKVILMKNWYGIVGSW